MVEMNLYVCMSNALRNTTFGSIIDGFLNYKFLKLAIKCRKFDLE